MYLGIDLGTTGVKSLLIDADQHIIASTAALLGVTRAQPGWSEQNPVDWIHAVEQSLEKLKAKHGKALADVRGIGLSGQMHGAVLLGENDHVLRPCILWNDTRSYRQAARLDADARFRSISGNIVFPGFTAPKLVWVRENEPAIFEQVCRVLLPKDFIRLWLTGEHVGDMSDASGTSWLDTGARQWSSELLAATDMRSDQMPRLVESIDVSGMLRSSLAERWGMTGGVVVAGGAGDNAASAIGTGTVSAGSAFVSLGTSGVLFAANERYLPNPASAVHSFCHALPDTWHQMGVILSATAALDWFAGLIGDTPAEMASALGGRLAAPGPVIFLPYLSGERTPHNDAAIRGAFIGLASESDRLVLARAVMEGVAFALRDNLEALRSTGTDLLRITAVGGGSRSHYWLQVVATALNVPIDLPVEGDFGAAFGAARLGIIAATGANPLEICRPPPTAMTIEPQQTLRAAFEEMYHRYRAIYPALAAVAGNSRSRLNGRDSLQDV